MTTPQLVSKHDVCRQCNKPIRGIGQIADIINKTFHGQVNLLTANI